ncbi:terminase (plasmid) [Pseudoalteromonas sp. T1lg65]|uniref:terminase n=1 Tax=Pseudoalteromonas sp. T1lg65 TaxID=2077101 RepID=UPI003F7A4D31
MKVSELVAWQWQGYAKYHRNKFNLILHILLVPIFIIGFGLLLSSVLLVNFWLAIVSLGLMGGSIIMQGVGHGKESLPAEPFTGPLNVVSRILLEQLYTFPKFVITGKWYKALRTSAQTSS